MPKRATALTAVAGEHYVAYKLSEMGYLVAMTRGGTPSIDLMVCHPSGAPSISLQVKTSSCAYRPFKRDQSKNRWEWDVSVRALNLKDKSVFYAFVDLEQGPDDSPRPNVFFIPSKTVAESLPPTSKRYMFWLSKTDKEIDQYGWKAIRDKLGVIDT